MNSNLPAFATNAKPSIRIFAAAVSYRIPRPVTKVIAYSKTSYPICPRCAVSLEREYMAFCDRCGQKLNWDFLEHAKMIYPEY